MGQWEYKVVPTPRRPKRAKGVKGNSDRFAFALTEAINDVASEGWEFVKTETLPMEAKPGLFKARVEVFQSLMVFRRPMPGAQDEEYTGPGVILPVTAANAAAAAAAGGYVAPNGDNQSAMSAVEAADEEVAEMAEGADVTDEVVEAAEEAVEERAQEEVAFDMGNIDPLKRMVEANRSDS